MIEGALINVEFDITFNINYTEDLDKPQSETFNRTSSKFKDLLRDQYKSMSNFEDVIILRFWHGSLGVRYRVVLKAVDNNNQTVETRTLVQEMKAMKEKLMALPDVNKDYVNKTFDDAVKTFTEIVSEALEDKCHLENICQAEFVCDKASQRCVSKCTCSDNGECYRYIDGRRVAQCRCGDDVSESSETDDCSTSPQHHAGLSQNEVIAISTGLSGAMFIIGVIVAMAIHKRKQRNRNAIVPIYDESDESTSSVDLANNQDFPAMENGRSNFYIKPKEADVPPFIVQSAPSMFEPYQVPGSGRGSIHIPRVRPPHFTPRDRLWLDGSSLPSLSNSTPGRLQSWTVRAGSNNHTTFPEERNGRTLSNIRHYEHR